MSNQDSANTGTAGATSASQDSKPTASQDPKAAQKPKAEARLPKVARVRSLVGDTRHLLQDKLIDARGDKIDIDDFAKAQIAAGKWELAD